MALGFALGMLQVEAIDTVANVVATIYTRLFRLVAVPTIVITVTLTLATLGTGATTRRIFTRTLTYTLLTTFVAASVALGLFMIVQPAVNIAGAMPTVADDAPTQSYLEYLITVVPDNLLRPLLEGNVLSLLLLSFAGGLGLSRLRDSEPVKVLVSVLQGAQELLFLLIRALIQTLPLGILAFSAQLTAQLQADETALGLGAYIIVVLGAGAVQFFVVLPLFLLARGLNPLTTFRAMLPAVLMALFTKSSAATLPVTMETAEQRLGVQSRVARFVLPICTTINMNGCAAFILATSLFVMHSAGVPFSPAMLIVWLVVSVLAAVGNAGIPMGCYFLTLSLISDVQGAPAIMGLVLPAYALLDMFETAENVWADSCVCAMTNKDINRAETA